MQTQDARQSWSARDCVFTSDATLTQMGNRLLGTLGPRCIAATPRPRPPRRRTEVHGASTGGVSTNDTTYGRRAIVVLAMCEHGTWGAHWRGAMENLSVCSLCVQCMRLWVQKKHSTHEQGRSSYYMARHGNRGHALLAVRRCRAVLWFRPSRGECGTPTGRIYVRIVLQ